MKFSINMQCTNNVDIVVSQYRIYSRNDQIITGTIVAVSPLSALVSPVVAAVIVALWLLLLQLVFLSFLSSGAFKRPVCCCDLSCRPR